MRDYLDRSAKKITATFLTNYRVVDLTGRKIIASTHARSHKALIVAQIKIGLRSVVRHEDLTMLKRTHGPRIHINVRIQFDHCH